MKKILLLFVLFFTLFVSGQKAITVTEELKQSNKQIFGSLIEGSIRQIAIPNSFFSLTYNPGQRTDGYRTLANSIHESDGFFDVVFPGFDPATQKLGSIFFNTTNFTFPVVALTAQEQTDFQQQVDDNDSSSAFIQNHKVNGVIAFDRAMSLIQRRLDNAIITGPQALGLAQGLYPELEPLYKGAWRLVKDNLATVTPPVNVDLLAIFNLIKDAVDQYVADNF